MFPESCENMCNLLKLYVVQGCVHPRQNGAKYLLNGNGGALSKSCNYGSRAFVVFFLKNFQEPDEIGINTCLLLKNARCYNVLPSLSLPSRIKENIPIE